MKKLLLLLVMTATVTTYSIAQEQKDVKQDKAQWEKKIKDDLKLTSDQTVKFDAINKEYTQKIEALMSDASATNKDAQKEKKMALKKEKESKILEFLTPEQQTKFKELMDQKQKEMSDKPKS